MSVSIDSPSLAFAAEISINVGEPVAVGETGHGLRRVVPILGGVVKGPRLAGSVVAAGADYQVLQADGMSTLDARYVLQADDGALVYIVNEGIRRGPPDLMARLARGEPVDPAAIYFRTAPRFETAAPKYQWLTQSLFIASGVRHPDKVIITVFEVR